MTVRSNEGAEGKSLSEPASPNVKLYVVVACIAALVLVAIVQVDLSVIVVLFTTIFRPAALFSK